MIDLEKGQVDLEGTIRVNDGFLELVACTKDTKEDESIVAVVARPMYIHTALLLVGATNGHLNAAGTGVLTFLLLAKECGADVPDHALHDGLVHFYRYAGRGLNPYGDNRTEVGLVDNGKKGKLAFAMAAAAALTPDGEDSVYADARDALMVPSASSAERAMTRSCGALLTR